MCRGSARQGAAVTSLEDYTVHTLGTLIHLLIGLELWRNFRNSREEIFAIAFSLESRAKLQGFILSALRESAFYMHSRTIILIY
jgi:hypothetical protein